MEPERPIEKLLHGYARKRRKDAGQPFTLHGADRRLLQDEVSRQFSHQKVAEISASPDLGWLPRLRWAFSTVAGIALAALLMWPGVDRGKQGKFTLAQKNAYLPAVSKTEKEQVFSDRDQLSSNLLANRFGMAMNSPSVPGNSSKSNLSIVRTDSVSDLAANGVAAGRRVLEPDNSQTLATPSEKPSAPSESQLASRARSVSAEMAPAPSPAAAAATTDKFALKGGSPVLGTDRMEKAKTDDRKIPSRQRFTAMLVSHETKKSAAVDGTDSVPLSTFDFEQTGSEIKIVDNDGSTYIGSVRSLDDSARRTEGVLMRSAPVATLGGAGVASKPSTDSAALGLPGKSGMLTFQVAGTNRTLGKSIVFTGQFTPESPVSTPTYVTNGFKVTNSPQDSQHPLPSQILGTAVVDGRDSIPINAVHRVP